MVRMMCDNLARVSVILVLCIMLTVATPICAESGMIVSIGSATGVPGSVVTIEVKLSNVSARGISSGIFNIENDSDKFIFTPPCIAGDIVTNKSADVSCSIIKDNNSQLRVMYSDYDQTETSYISKDGLMLTLKYKIDEKCPAGTYNIIGNTTDDFYDKDVEALPTPSFVGGTITVTSSSSITITPTQSGTIPTATIEASTGLQTSILTPTPTKNAAQLVGGLPTATPVVSQSTYNNSQVGKVEIIEDDPIPFTGASNLLDLSGHWSNKYVSTLIEKGIASGYPDGTFKPNANVTRAEATVFIIKMLGLQASEDTTLGFADGTQIPKWAKGYIKTGIDNGIVSGYKDNTFMAAKSITREEMAVIIIRALKKTSINQQETSFIDDKDISKWSRGYVVKTIENGLINGYPDGTFKPKNNITRAEVSALISNSFN